MMISLGVCWRRRGLRLHRSGIHESTLFMTLYPKRRRLISRMVSGLMAASADPLRQYAGRCNRGRSLLPHPRDAFLLRGAGWFRSQPRVDYHFVDMGLILFPFSMVHLEVQVS